MNSKLFWHAREPKKSTRQLKKDHLVKRLLVKGTKRLTLHYMDKTLTAANPHAVALGRMGKGIKKTMSVEAIQQRKDAAKARSKAAKVRREKLKCP